MERRSPFPEHCTNPEGLDITTPLKTIWVERIKATHGLEHARGTGIRGRSRVSIVNGRIREGPGCVLNKQPKSTLKKVVIG